MAKSMTRTKTTSAAAKEVLDQELEAVEVQDEQIEVKAEVKPKVENKKPVKKHKYSNEDGIECVSITAGELGMIGIKSGINYTWAGRGDITEVEYQDLVAAVRSGKPHIFDPCFVILEDDFVKEFPQINRIYSKMFSTQELEEVFNLPVAQMKTTILSLPEGAKESIKHIASSMISNGTLDSVQKIKALDEIFNTKFMLMTELFS